MFNLLKVVQKNFQKQHTIVQLIIAIVIILCVRWLFNTLVYSNFSAKYLESFGTPKQLLYFHMNGRGALIVNLAIKQSSFFWPRNYVRHR